MTHKVVIGNAYTRQRAHALIDRAPPGYVMTIAEPKRSNAQNDKMHAMLTDISVSKPGGRKLLKDQWKCLFLDALARETGNGRMQSRWEPGLDGEGVVNIGYSSSRLRVSEMAELITFIQAWGDANGVGWSDGEQAEAA